MCTHTHIFFLPVETKKGVGSSFVKHSLSSPQQTSSADTLSLSKFKYLWLLTTGECGVWLWFAFFCTCDN